MKNAYAQQNLKSIKTLSGQTVVLVLFQFNFWNQIEPQNEVDSKLDIISNS